MNETRLCFRRIDRLAQSYVARNTRGSGLTPAQIQALRHITWHGTMSQQELVEDMGIDKAAVTRLAAALEEKGYLVRSTDPKDGRAKLIHATEAAYAVRDDFISLEAAYYDWLLAGLPEEERAVFVRQLSDLLERAREGRRCGCEGGCQGSDRP